MKLICSNYRFSKEHEFRKPNDERALMLMDKAAQSLMNEYQDIILAFGESDEYSYEGLFICDP